LESRLENKPMNVVALLGGAIGAVIGAAIWAAIAYFTNYEVGYVAWAVGGLVGLGAKLLGGRGAVTAAACAGLALVAIFVGKMGAVKLSLPGELREIANTVVTRETYDERLSDARAFVELKSEDDYPAFMAEHGFVEGDDPSAVTPEELESFKQEVVPDLRDTAANPPAYEAWREAEIARFEGFAKDVSLAQAVKENLGVIDLIFAGLGLVTAYQIVARESA
jgi:hypothetical protein